MHKWMEELFDTLLYLGFVMGMLMFSACYWNGACQLRGAELVVEEFLNVVAAEGKISLEEYEKLLQGLYRLNSSYEPEILCSRYVLIPCYAQIPKEKLDSYYMERNVRAEVILQQGDIEVVQENAEELRLLEETNASLLAAKNSDYLPLPEQGSEWHVQAVFDRQEVYEGESLITLCKISSEQGNYYAEAKEKTASTSGMTCLELQIEEEAIQVPVEVICYPRIVTCIYGHEIVNSKEKIEEFKQTGNFTCPYCAVFPASMKCQTNFLYKRTGEPINKEELWLEVTFMDGHKECITPEAIEWQDDYDENYCGIQIVTVQFRSLEEFVTVISENGGCKQCNAACNERCFADYTSFPYCTKCMSETLLFTGEVYEEEKQIPFEKMVSVLDKEGEMLLNAEDLITVKINNRGTVRSILHRDVMRDGKR